MGVPAIDMPLADDDFYSYNEGGTVLPKKPVPKRQAYFNYSAYIVGFMNTSTREIVSVRCFSSSAMNTTLTGGNLFPIDIMCADKYSSYADAYKAIIKSLAYLIYENPMYAWLATPGLLDVRLELDLIEVMNKNLGLSFSRYSEIQAFNDIIRNKSY